MPLHLRSNEYHHEIQFPTLSSTPPPGATDHLTWGPSQIHISSGTYLDAAANIWFHIPDVNLQSAQRWCEKQKITYLGAWHSHSSDLRGFGFSVAHFSRYRYVDTDSDEENAPDDPSAPPVPSQPAARPAPRVSPLADVASLRDIDDDEPATVELQQTRPQSAQYPYRQSVLRGPGRTPAVRNVPESPPQQRSTRRPRMSMPGLDVDEDMDSGSTSVGDDHDESQDIDAQEFSPSANMTHSDDDHQLAVYQPPKRHYDSSIDAPKLHMLRAALFDENQIDARPSPFRMGTVDEPPFGQDVKMEDIPGAKTEPSEHDLYELPVEEEEVESDDDEDYIEGENGQMGAITREGIHLDSMFPISALPFPLSVDSIAASKEGVSKDTGLMLGRSTRLAFHQNGALAQTMYGDTRADAFPSHGFCIRLDNIHATNYALSDDWVRNALRIHCDAWYTSHLDAAELPDETHNSIKLSGKLGAIKVPSLRAAFRFGIVADRIMEQFVEELKRTHEGEDENALHAQVAVWLLLALYKNGDIPGTEGEDTLLRRLALWGEGPAGTAFDEEMPKEVSLRKALLLLTIGDVENAVAVAIESGNLRLAMLMSRALEVTKEDLRADAEAQLVAYGVVEQPDENIESQPRAADDEEKWDRCLEDFEEESAVSVDERMILLILAGHIAPVARYLGLSWYRMFIMELLHGAGSSESTQAERVSDAVEAVTKSGIPTYAAHGNSLDTDVVYHLLRLYADPTASYPLTSGVYENGSYGVKYCPMDSRFSWLLHQILSALIPQATTKRAAVVLADAYSSQLRSMDMPLWAFYVLCTGGGSPDVLKNCLIRDWPQMADDYVDWKCDELESLVTKPSTSGEGGMEDEESADTEGIMHAEAFLTAVLGVPTSWIDEAKAVAKYSSGDQLGSCRHWIASGTEEGASFAHDVLASEVFPELVSKFDSASMTTVADLLTKLSTCQHVSNWSCAGGVILDYLKYVVGVPFLQPVTMDVLRGMVPRVETMCSRAATRMQQHAVSTIADGIATAQRALVLRAPGESRKSMLEQAVIDLERLACSRGVKLRVAGEYKIEEEYGPAYAHRFASAFPPYAKFLDLRDGSMRRSSDAVAVTADASV